MAHGILLNKYEAEIDYNAINRDYDVFQISGDSEQYKKTNILDFPEAEFKALSVQYMFGKTAFVLFRKGDISETEFRAVMQERFEDVCVKRVDVTDQQACKDSNLYDNALLQLLANSVKVPKNKLFTYNNTTGKLYYLTPRWKKANSFYSIEIKFEKDSIIALSVRSFRKKDKKDKSAVFVFDPVTGELRKKLSRDNDLTEYVMRGNPKKKNTVDFLRFNSKDEFYHSKLGILSRFLSDFEEEFGDYVSIRLKETENTCNYEIPKDKKSQEIYDCYGKLLGNRVNIVDEVKSPESEVLIKKICNELKQYYGIQADVGALSPDMSNIRLIHDPEYYKTNNIADEHNTIPDGVVVQHLMIEQTMHLKPSTAKDKPSVDIRKIVQELIIKRDILNREISVFDWNSLGYENDVVFICREEIKNEDDEQDGKKKKEKQYIYKLLSVSPQGKLTFRSFDTREWLNETDSNIVSVYEDHCNRYARYPNTIEGLIVLDGDKYYAIVRTVCTTMPNIKAIADSHEQKEFSKEVLFDAVSAFIEERPEYQEYAQRFAEKIKAGGSLTYEYANICLDLQHNRNAGRALNRFIYENYGIRINPEIKSQDFDEEYLLKNIYNIRYYTEKSWDGNSVLVYFVGPKRSNLKTSVHNACVIRKIYSDNTMIEPKSIFPLMTVEFVRNEQYTVIPFPFKYLREYH